MAMKSLSSPRRVYTRKGSPLVCYAGRYFTKLSAGDSKITDRLTVRIEVLPRSHGKARIQVSQSGPSGANTVLENWGETNLS